MESVCYYPSMIFDAICYFQQRSLNDRNWMFKEEIRVIEDINRKLSDKVDDGCLGMSTLSLIISTYTNNENLERFTLDDLISVFANINDVDVVVRQRTKNDYTASYVFPTLDWLKDGWADIYINKLKALKSIGFEDMWKNEMYPIIFEHIVKKQEAISHIDLSGILRNIAILKDTVEITNVKIFVSFLSYPTAFTLYNGCFLDNIADSDGIVFMIAHELMHGFASDELIGYYLDYVKTSEYRRECYRILIDEMHSGNEEEFVTAVEYYLGYLAGEIKKENIIEIANKRYGGCMPLSIKVFDLLTNEATIPHNYNNWLIVKFKDNVFA